MTRSNARTRESVDRGETADREPTGGADGPIVPTALRYLRMIVYALTGLLGLSLLLIGTTAIVAELQGTWHWQLHLESTVSYMGVIVAAIVSVLVPLFALLVVGRLWYAVAGGS